MKQQKMQLHQKFVEDVKVVSDGEVMRENDNLQQARKLFQQMNALLNQEEKGLNELRDEKGSIENQLKDLQFKINQSENSEFNYRKLFKTEEGKIKKAISNTEDDIKRETFRLKNQQTEIHQRDIEIQNLEEEIDRNKSLASEMKSKFLSENHPSFK